MERWLAMWKHRGLDLPAGTIFDGLRRIALLLKPIHAAIWARTASGGFTPADETRWLMFVMQAGKTGHMWWLWAFLSADAIGFRLDPTRAHDVPEKHFAAVLENGVGKRCFDGADGRSVLGLQSDEAGQAGPDLVGVLLVAGTDAQRWSDATSSKRMSKTRVAVRGRSIG